MKKNVFTQKINTEHKKKIEKTISELADSNAIVQKKTLYNYEDTVLHNYFHKVERTK